MTRHKARRLYEGTLKPRVGLASMKASPIVAARVAHAAGAVLASAEKHDKEAEQHDEEHDMHEHEESGGTPIDKEIDKWNTYLHQAFRVSTCPLREVPAMRKAT